jgi:DNA-binding PucR family transcriptional regulator
VAVLSADSDSALQTLTEWLGSAGSYTLGFSEPVHAPSEVPLAMRQSQWTAHLARTTGRDVLDFGRLGFDRLLFPSVEVVDIDLTRPLQQLRGETATLGFDPAETLEAFLDTGGNIRDAARRLLVHANTLRYRLSRIEATCGLDLDDPHCRFDLQLAFRQEASWRILRGEA